MKLFENLVLLISLPSCFGLAKAPQPKLTRCLSLTIKPTGEKSVRLVSAKISWVELALYSEKSDYRIELTGVSGRIYSSFCNMGSRMGPAPPVEVHEPQPVDERQRLILQLPVFPATKSKGTPIRRGPVGDSRDPEGSSNLIGASIPCNEDCVGYRITNIRTGELVGEEWFKTFQKPTIELESAGPSKWRIKTGGLPATISLHYSFDDGKSWIPGEVIVGESEFPLESSQMHWHQRKQQTHDSSQIVTADDLVVAEAQVMVGLRLYRQRFKVGKTVVILPTEGIPEIK